MTETRRDIDGLNRDAVAALDTNNGAAAESLLGQALAASPRNAVSLQLMGLVRRMQGRPAEAEDYYRRSLAVDPSQPHVHHNLGNLLLAQNRVDAAVAAQREAIQLKRNYAGAHLGLALALSAMGDHREAEKSCRRALQAQPNFAAAQQALAVELNELERPKDAEQILRRMLASGVRDPRMMPALEHNLGVALKRQGRYDEALALFDSARAKAPGMAAIEYNRADTLQLLGRFDEAMKSFGRALELEPGNAEYLSSTAMAAARSKEFDKAQSFANSAIAIDPHQGLALAALALAAVEQERFSDAHEILSRILDGEMMSADRRIHSAIALIADAFERHGQPSAAFAAYAAANAQRRAFVADAFQSNRAGEEVRRLIAYFENSPPWAPSPAPAALANEAGAHAFVLGFMRSGTTLLTAALAGHERVVAIDERELLTEPARAYLLADVGLDRLQAIPESEAAKWAAIYWKSVRDAGFAVADKVFIDKMPFNSLRMPLIARLFPRAKVIFAVRDPRDVVFSCFRRRFDIGTYSFEFLSLEDCARFYAACMSLAELYREKLPLEILYHRYEDMVGEFEVTMRRASDFIGIEWRDSMRDFASLAGTIDQRSASLFQVRRGLYGDAAGLWRKYRNELAPIMPILRPWIERFGYPLD